MSLQPQFQNRPLTFHPAPKINKRFPLTRMVSAEIEVACLETSCPGHSARNVDLTVPWCRVCGRPVTAIPLDGYGGTSPSIARRACVCNGPGREPNPLTSREHIPTTVGAYAREAGYTASYLLNLDQYRNRCTCIQPLETVFNAWGASVVADGSLPPDSGFEINTAPAGGDKLHDQITAICNALNALDAVVTAACGCHLHFDGRDLGWFDLRRVIMLYHATERALFAMVPSRRRNNSYCRPCGESLLRMVSGQSTKAIKTHELKAGLVRGLYQIDMDRKVIAGNGKIDHYVARETKSAIDSAKHHKYADSRYNALNVHSWLHRGSLEWRLPTGSTNAGKILGFAAVFSNLIKIAMRISEKEIRARLDAQRRFDTRAQKTYQIDLLRDLLDGQAREFFTARTRLYGRLFTGSLDQDYNRDCDDDTDNE